MALVGFVPFALTNVVMLLMARNATRQREFSLRLALGAGRGALLRLLFMESLLLVTAGGFLAWAFAVASTRILGQWAQIEASLAPDRTVLLFTLTALAIAALLFGLAPPSSGSRRQSGTSTRELPLPLSNNDAGKSQAGRIVVTLQLAMCVVLLCRAEVCPSALCVTSKNTSLGMDVNGLVVFGVTPSIPSIPEGYAIYANLLDKLRALPGVESVIPSWRSALAPGRPITATCKSMAGCPMSPGDHPEQCSTW